MPARKCNVCVERSSIDGTCAPLHLGDLGVNTVLYGNGAMARVVYDYVATSLSVTGFCVDAACIPAGEQRFQGLPLVPFESVVAAFPPEKHRMLIAVGFSEMNRLRAARAEQACAYGYQLASYVHPSVHLGSDVSIGANCVILDHVSIHVGSRIGSGTFISSNVNIGHDCDIAADNWINAGVALAGGCRVGCACFFGVNASVSDGVSVGDRSYIAAQAHIARDTEPESVHLAPGSERFRLTSSQFLEFKRS